ncbi:MAG TPA: hypothetical protein HPP80_03370 [Rhodospirillaceae bacterium]|nr:hypothetical protein [Rhodospirillaceae bacterium]
MMTFLSSVLTITLATLLVILAVGVVVFVRGGRFNQRWSNRLMTLRVGVQALAVVVLAVIFLLRHIAMR